MAINSLSHTSHGFAGIASGMNTEEMVQKMLYGTQTKLNRAKADKAVLSYKRDLYRDIAASLKTFQNNFFSFNSGSKTNMLSQSFFRNIVAKSNSTAVKVSTTGNANPGKVTVNKIDQLAQNLKAESSSTVSAEVKGNINFDSLKEGISLDIKLDGVTKKITLTKDELADVNSNSEKFKDLLQKKINQNIGGGITVNTTSDGKISFSANNGRAFEIYGDTAALGIKNGASNRVNLNTALKNTSLADKLQGDTFKFSINGKEFSFSKENSLNDIISAVNSSDAGVKLSYSSLSDKFTIESTVAGKDSTIELKQTTGNFLNAIFGENVIGAGATITTKPLELKLDNIKADINGKETSLVEEINRLTKDGNAHTFKFSIDGQTYTADIKQNGNEFKTIDEVVEALNKADLKGDDGQSVGKVSDKIKFTKTGDQIVATPQSPANKDTLVQLSSGFDAIGFNSGASNRGTIDENTKLSDLGFEGTIEIGGKTITVNSTTTIGSLNQELKANNIDAEIDLKQTPPRFQFAGVKLPIPIQIKPASTYKNIFFEQDKIEANTNPQDTIIIGNNNNGTDGETFDINGLSVTEGQNAKLEINGQTVERNSNNFEFEGINIELKETTKPGDKPIEIEVSQEDAGTFDGIVKFMDEYNKLIDKMWELVKAKPTYKEYPPLTDEQKKEMTENEIKLWEEKSKEGLLRSDPTLQAITNAMREVLNYKPEGSKYSLADLGITTTYDFQKGYGGKLVFTDSTGEKFKNMLKNEPDAVEKLFLGNDGISNKLNEVIKSATTSARPGSKYYDLSLVSIAGSNGVPDTKSKLYNQMKNIDENIAKIERRYKMEYNRYWKQFNAMEKAIQQMNSQSSWLAQQFMG